MHEELIIQKLVELDEKVSRMLPIVEEFPTFKEHVLVTLDHHTHLLERLDHERLANFARVERVEGRVDRLEKHTGLA